MNEQKQRDLTGEEMLVLTALACVQKQLLEMDKKLDRLLGFSKRGEKPKTKKRKPK